MIKTLGKLGIQGNFLNVIRGISMKDPQLTSDIMFKG